MKRIFLLAFCILFINACQLLAQSKTESYVVMLNHDTVYMSPLKLRHSKIVCTVNGVQKKYKAKEVLAYKFRDQVGESARACAIIIGFKRWLLLEREITGKVGLFTVSTSQNDISSTGRVNTTVYFYKKVGEPRGKIYKLLSWGKLERYLSDCAAYVRKSKSKEPFQYLQDQITYYNENCK